MSPSGPASPPACPPGFAPDNSLYHLGEAGQCLPDDLLLIFFVEFVVVNAIIALFGVRRALKSRSQARKLILFSLLGQVFACALLASIYAQNGIWQASLVFNIAWVISMSQIGLLLLDLAITPQFKLEFQDPVHLLQRLKLMNACFNVSVTAVVITQLVFVNDPRAFNIGEATFIVCVIVQVIFLVGMSIYFLGRLETKIKQMDTPAMASRDKLVEFVAKIRQLRRTLMFFIIAVPPPALYPVLLYIILEYVPIQWICIVVSFHATPFLSVACILMATWRGTSGSSSAPKSTSSTGGVKKNRSSANQNVVASPSGAGGSSFYASQDVASSAA